MDIIQKAEAVVLALEDKFVCGHCLGTFDCADKDLYWEADICTDCAGAINYQRQLLEAEAQWMQEQDAIREREADERWDREAYARFRDRENW